MSDRLTPITDDRGRMLVRTPQPLPGSIMLTDGEHGTAWQRHFYDGLWHSTRGGPAQPWAKMIARRNLVLVYDAPARPSEGKAGDGIKVQFHTWATGEGN